MAQPAQNDSEKPAEGKFGRVLAPASFRAVERLLLLTIAAMTMAAAGVEIFRVISERSVNLADILLMFLYAEVIGMVAVFYGGQQSPFIYPIFIAITAVARLIVLQGTSAVHRGLDHHPRQQIMKGCRSGRGWIRP
ncbi:MAG: phosphate-starvation-inducible E [Caulobacteraceae bacterium]|nr:phosphate-starvation-inducible E [Caulobacteraceae bacterium]